MCPRVYCIGCNVVPCGRSDLPGLDTVKLFCSNCNDIYVPPSSRFQGVDGIYIDQAHIPVELTFSSQAPSLEPLLLISSSKATGNSHQRLSGSPVPPALHCRLVDLRGGLRIIQLGNRPSLTQIHTEARSGLQGTFMCRGYMASKSARKPSVVHACNGLDYARRVRRKWNL